MPVWEWCKAIFYGMLEGITEWLPISSTGHLILIEEWIPFRFTSDEALLSAFSEMFEVVIQLGAVFAVILLYWQRLCPFFGQKTRIEKRRVRRLWGMVCIATLPAAAAGILLDRLCERVTGRELGELLYTPTVVAIALIAYGIAFLLAERHLRDRVPRIASTEAITGRAALGVGAFQMLSLIPGTSRSGSTVLGAMLLGFSRSTGAEFSFFMAIPVMAGAAAIKVGGFLSHVTEGGMRVPLQAWLILATASLVSFLVSLTVIRFLIDFVKRHGFAPFGIYRILLGVAILLWRVC